ncbi:ATP synthase F0, A subunit [gut metagenome]|uniref:ATP synthase F0, A subunit n=1 Tax=gut metagenome TaxID=749906 RepID=J9H5T1_9ZZZZ
MKHLKHISYLLIFAFVCLLPTSIKAQEQGGTDVKEIVLGHLSDAYDWHITTWNGHHISIPLPVIVKGEESGWHMFSSSQLAHGHSYEGFYIDNERNGKIYEKLANGEVVRPYDFSITKNVVQIWITAALMLLIFIGSARWYRNRKPGDSAPRGFVGLVEMFVMMVHDDIIKPSVGESQYKRYAPFLLTAFFFIFITNLLGLIPLFPGGANVTGNITITFFLACCTLLVTNLFGNKEYWKEIFWPEVPTWLKVPIPMMPVIELFGIFTKPFALMVRLFANILGGHAIILSLTCVIFITWQINAVIGTSFSLISFVLMIFMNCLELLVAFIQAYVFTMLSAIFIGLAHPEHHH